MKRFKFEQLPWDSEFFGYEVVSLNLSELDSSVSLKEVRNEMRSEKLCYVFSSKAGNNDIGAFEDEKVVLERKLTINEVVHTHSFDSATEVDFAKLLPLAYASGAFSRFRLDENFKQHEFERLYDTWLTKSLSRELADEVFHMPSQDSSLGFVTLKHRNNLIEIGLIATDENVRGKGIGTKLIEACMSYAHCKKCSIIRVPTQRINTSAINFYKKNNFHELENTHIYHVWK